MGALQERKPARKSKTSLQFQMEKLTSQDDNVRCFFCDGGLRNWEAEDDPFTEHARWFPRCAFIREVLGDAFVDALASRYPGVQNLPNTAPQEPMARGSTGAGGTSGACSTTTSNPRQNRVPGVEYRVDEREIKARMDTPAVRAVLDMGFERSVVLNALRKRLRERGQDFPSGEMLLEALFEEENTSIRLQEEEETETTASSSQNNTTISTEPGSPARMSPGLGTATVPPPRPRDSTTASDPTPQPPASSTSTNAATAPNTSSTTAATAPNTSAGSATGSRRRGKKNRKKREQGESELEDRGINTSVGKSAEEIPGSTEAKALLEENRALKDQRMCKVCMDAEGNIVFLPCGHLVCCANCAPSLRKCAVCRSLIRGTVRTYLS